MESIIVYSGGRSQGDPGPTAVGVYITTAEGELVHEVKAAIGNATNTFAEYYAVMLALQTLSGLYGAATPGMQFEIRLDSEVVKKQLSAESQINEPGLVPMFIEIHNMRVSSFPHVSFTNIAPDQNKEVVRLVREAFAK